MVIRGDHKGAEQWTRDALEQGVRARQIIDEGLIVGMDEVGRRFKANEYHMPEVLIAARAMSNYKERDTRPGAMEILQPHLESYYFLIFLQ